MKYQIPNHAFNGNQMIHPSVHIHTPEVIKPAVLTGKELRILLLEDNVNDAELISMYLRVSYAEVKIKLVADREEYMNALHRQEFDVILSDHNIPGFGSLEALRMRNELKLQVPFILISGALPEEYAVSILQEGASDYILKDRPQRLFTAITEAIIKQKTLAARALAEEELKKSEQRFRYLVENGNDMLTLSNNEGIFTYISPNIKNIMGYEGEDSPDMGYKVIHTEDQHIYHDVFKKLRQYPGTIFPFSYRIKDKSGTWKWIEGTVNNLLNVPEVGAVVTNFRDISERKRLEESLLSEKILHQKQNTAVALRSQEEERNRIGKELHDNINQLMAFSKMMIDTARNSPEIHDMCIDKGYEGINMAIEEVRKLSHTLVPPKFSVENSFIEAVNNIVEDVKISGKFDTVIDIPANGQFSAAGEKVKLTFYRIIQEQLNNIVKYSGCSEAMIRIEILNGYYLLTIKDNGIGFDKEKKQEGIGLLNMASRAELLGGHIEIDTFPGKGCSLSVSIPVSHNCK